MELVKTSDDIKVNIEKLKQYLGSENQDLKDFALNRVKKGRCFVVYRLDDKFHFAPSRFIGYIRNTHENHEANKFKDGKETNPAISKVLNGKLVFKPDLENYFIDYCSKLGVKPDNVNRTFWVRKNESEETIIIELD